MTASADREAEAACLLSLEAALAAESPPDLRRFSAEVIDGALQALVRRHGAAAAALLRSLAERAPSKDVTKSARRALYRLAQAGAIQPTAPTSPARPVVRRSAEEPVRAWLSAIDGMGSRAVWILFEGGLGGQLQLCSLILNDEAGILETAGGAITRKRLDTELRQLREHQKLPWVETDPARACALVAEALDLHHERGTAPPVEFSRWHRLFSAVPGGPPADRLPASPAKEVDARLLERSAELLEIPEFGGWFVDPGEIHEQSLALLQLRESRLVVSEQIKGEREAAIVDDVVSSQFASEARRRWARRVNEMALIFRSTGRDDLAQLTGATAQALADEGRPAGRIPFVRALAMRGLTVGAEVALGRAKLADVSRSPSRTTAR